MASKMMKSILDKMPARSMKWILNLWPPFRGAGIKVDYISADYREVKVSLRPKLFTRNYVGTHFGGSLFAMSDPFFMLIVMRYLGKEYIVWDKSAAIQFVKPAKGKIVGYFAFSEAELIAIKQEADQLEKYIFSREAQLVNEENEVVAIIKKTLYVRRKQRKA